MTHLRACGKSCEERQTTDSISMGGLRCGVILVYRIDPNYGCKMLQDEGIECGPNQTKLCTILQDAEVYPF